MANFNKIFLKVVLLLSSEHHSVVSRDYLVCLFQALSSFTSKKKLKLVKC